MSGSDNGGGGGSRPTATSRRARFSVIWLIPIIALVVAVFLGFRTIQSQGALIIIKFQSADGLAAGQTQVKHKNVALGTVENIRLSDDMRYVLVRIRMKRDADKILTSQARFWVVRPRLSGANVSGLETLVSGAYIAVDPGRLGGPRQTEFSGLEAPPGVQSDDPGRTFTLMTGTVNSIGEGSPISFRGVSVGEVLGYTMPPGGRGPVPVKAFIKEPYDHYVHVKTRFWNTSGVDITFGSKGVHLQIESLQAVLSGGVGFGLPQDQRDKDAPEAPDGSVFRLYDSKDEADSAGYHQRIPFVTYLQNSVKGLDPGSEVDMFGIQIGSVTDVRLQLDPSAGTARVRVAMEIQPERAFASDARHGESVEEVSRHLVEQGMRVQLSSASFITGASLLSFEFVANAKPASIGKEGDAIVLPSERGGLSGITDSLSDVAAKLDGLPLVQIADHLDDLLAGASQTVNGNDLKSAIHGLSGTLKSIHELADHANHGATPLLDRLPAMSAELQDTLHHANEAVSSYGGDSDFNANLNQLLGQLTDTARSLRLLADFIDRHPSSIVFGRTPPGQH